MIMDKILNETSHFCRGRSGMEIEIEHGEYEDVE